MSGPRLAPTRLGRRPALDGVRALAVIAVMFFHDSALALLPGGFLGVDVFFVLSGFLITSLLLIDDAQRGSPVSLNFWIHRIKRLLPAFLVLVLLVSAITLFSGDVTNTSALRIQGLASFAYVLNWYLISHRVEATMFFHTWSLSVEEQWYLVWPFLLAALLVLTRRHRNAMFAAIALLAVASAALMAVLGYGASNIIRASLGTDARAWELLAGAGLAVAVTGRGAITSRRAAWGVSASAVIGLMVLGWAFTSVSEADKTLYPGARLLVVAAALALIVAAVCAERAFVSRVLSWRPLVAIGLISYGLYLFHLPLFQFMTPDRMHVDGLGLFLVRMLVVTALATASYRWIEMPVRRGKLPVLPTVAYSAIGAAAVAGIFVFATLNPAPINYAYLERRDFRTLAADTPAGTIRVLVTGGDLAAQLLQGYRPPAELGGIRGGVATIGACSIAGGQRVVGAVAQPEPPCRPWTEVFREARKGYDPAVVVLMAGSSDLFDRRIDGTIVRAGSPELTSRLRSQLERAHRILTAGGVPMVLTTMPCAPPVPAGAGAVTTILRDRYRIAWLNSVWREFAAAHPRDVHLAELGTVLCPRGDPRAESFAGPLRPDGVTLSAAGAGTVWNWLAAIARRLVAS